VLGKVLIPKDFAIRPTNVNVSASKVPRIAIINFSLLWILLLITAAGIRQNTWFILAVGGIGIVQNIYVAGRRRFPKAFGVPLTFKCIIGEVSVMHTLFAVEQAYPRVGRSLLETHLPRVIRPEEERKWAELENIANGLYL